MRTRLLCLAVSAWILAFSSHARAVTIDFEGLADSTPVGDVYASLGIHFSNAIALTAGVSLNELEFPPSSGINAVADDTGPIRITFDEPIEAFSAEFAFSETLTISAYADTGFLTLWLTLTTLASGNLGSTIPLSFTVGPSGWVVGAIEIAGNSAGSSFILDDLTFSPASSVPEPNAALLFAAGVTIASRALRRNQNPSAFVSSRS
jgi:hypothetical protein